MSEIVFGNCSKHPGQNMVNCPLCEIEKLDTPEFNKVIGKAYDTVLKEEMNQLKKDFGVEDKPIDRHGDCPNCSTHWDGGDIYEVLSKMDVNVDKSPSDLAKLAGEYGWSPHDPKRFSNVNVVETDNNTFLQCWNCMHTYNAKTGEHFRTLVEAKSSEYYDDDDSYQTTQKSEGGVN